MTDRNRVLGWVDQIRCVDTGDIPCMYAWVALRVGQGQGRRNTLGCQGQGKEGPFRKCFCQYLTALHNSDCRRCCREASGGEELRKQRLPVLRDWRMWEPQTS